MRSVPEDVGAETAGCSGALRAAFGLLGKRWNGLILETLRRGPAGFSEVRRGVGSITDSVLSDRLNELTGAGLVTRTVSDGRPPTVSYALTDAGAAILPILAELAAWAETHLAPRCSEVGGQPGGSPC